MFNLCFCFCFLLFLRPVDARRNLISLSNVADMQEPPEPALLLAAVEAGDTSTLEFVLKKWPEKVYTYVLYIRESVDTLCMWW